MRIKFLDLVAENFMAYKRLDLDLRNLSGSLVLVAGENALSSPWSSNGSGKTTIAEAMYWCLYGTTMRKMPVGSIVNRFSLSKYCWVSLQLDSEGTVYAIRRTRTPNELSIGVEDSTTPVKGQAAEELLRKIFPISEKLFTSFVYFGGSDRGSGFHRLSDSDRKQTISELYPQLKELSELHELTSDKLSSAKTSAVSIDAALDSAARQYENLEHDLQRKQTELANTVRSSAATRAELGAKIEQLKQDIKVLEQQNAEYRIKYAQAGEHAQAEELAYRAKIEASLGMSLAELDGVCDASRLDLTDARRKIQDADKNIANIHRLLVCPTCHRQFDNVANKEKAVVELQEHKKLLQARLPYLEEVQRQYEITRNTCNAEVARIRNNSDLVAMGKFYLEINQKLAYAKESLEQAQRRYYAIGSQSDQLRSVIAGLEDSMGRLKAEIDDKISRKEICQHELEILEVLKSVLSPSGLPAMFMDSLLSKVEQYANVMSKHLTDGNLTISISIDKTDESYSREGSVNITAINSNGANLYGGNSSGERARVDLCILFGLIRAISATTGLEVSLLFLDEVLDAIDDAGVLAVVETLAKEVLPYRDSILLTTHNTSLHAHVSNMPNVRLLKVIKDGNISKLWEE